MARKRNQKSLFYRCRIMEGWGEFMRGRKKKKLSAKMFTAITAPLLAVLLVFSVLLSVITTGRFDLVLRDIFGEAGAEGFVLLYNRNEDGKGLPLEGGSALSLFSASSDDLLAGGTGSGVSKISSDMRTALTEQGFSVNEALWKFYSDNHGKYTRGGGHDPCFFHFPDRRRGA